MSASVSPEQETRCRIAEALRAAGLRAGGCALVHSSLSSLGYVPGGATTVIEGLLDALGPEGTLLMPALSYEHVHAHQPFFDVLRTPSNVGVIPETFRLRPGVLRSVNPTHSVCGIGPRACDLLTHHQKDETPCGLHSPFHLLRQVEGQIVFLGCGLRPNTSMHSVEELVEPPYLFGALIAYRVRLVSGEEITLRCRRHNFAGYTQRYDRLAGLLKARELRTGRVLRAIAHVIECAPMWERALSALRRDPFFFVERSEAHP
ncbi:MAG: AAC(3) family N-acetyltransferase [Anaerolineae bacterium]|nr:AAC(3) family N-acetyltransferase [Thermoflexales bacterium]MDW8407325.1 AAC(3) family N-acetyltransferase [Anaerolineae bacterium]